MTRQEAADEQQGTGRQSGVNDQRLMQARYRHDPDIEGAIRAAVL